MKSESGSPVVVGVYGASGFGREVMPMVRKMKSEGANRVCFIDDQPGDSRINGEDVLGWNEFQVLASKFQTAGVVLAISNGQTRHQLDERCRLAGIDQQTVRAASAIVMDGNEIGEGAILCDNTIITSNAKIGRSFHLNLFSYVAHDCVIGDFVTFAPGVKCNGNVHVEDFAYIGTGAIIRQGQPGKPLVIGAGAVVGMGAVVTKDVPAGATVVGNPARALR